jgi:hypothetical protein
MRSSNKEKFYERPGYSSQSVFMALTVNVDRAILLPFCNRLVRGGASYCFIYRPRILWLVGKIMLDLSGNQDRAIGFSQQWPYQFSQEPSGKTTKWLASDDDQVMVRIAYFSANLMFRVALFPADRALKV